MPTLLRRCPFFRRSSLLRLMMGVSLNGSTIVWWWAPALGGEPCPPGGVLLMSFSLVVSASSTTATSSSSSSSSCSGSRRLAVLPRGLRPRPLVVLRDGFCAGAGAGSSSARSDDARVLRFCLAVGAGRADISSSSSSSSTGGGNALADFGGRPGRLAGAADFVSICSGETVEDRVVVGGDAGMVPRFRPVLCLLFFVAAVDVVVVFSGVGAASSGAAVVLARLEPRVNVKSPSCSSYTAAAGKYKSKLAYCPLLTK